MLSLINELWHGNIIPQEDSRNNSKEMKELLGYMDEKSWCYRGLQGRYLIKVLPGNILVIQIISDSEID